MNFKKIASTLLIVMALLFATESYAQSMEKYDYAEVVVLQRAAKKESPVKDIYLNSSTDETLDKEKVATITSTTELMKFMNDADWEFVDRIYSQPSNTGPVWISYTFRKKE